MLTWLRQLLRRKPRPEPLAEVVRSLPAAGPRAARKRLTTTVEEFDAHLARRRGTP